MSPTLTFAATQAGIILGTAAYMSPEQAKGRAVDKRSDIWSFGCVLFEMLTGRRAFEGEDVSDTMAAVLRAEPDWDALPAALAAIDGADPSPLPREGSAQAYRRCVDDSIPAASEPAASSVGADPRVGPGRTHGSAPTRAVWSASPRSRSSSPPPLGGLVVWSARPRPATPVVSKFAVRLGEGQTFTNVGDLTRRHFARRIPHRLHARTSASTCDRCPTSTRNPFAAPT